MKKLSLPKMPNVKTKRGAWIFVAVVLILGLLVYGCASYFGNTSTAYHNASGVNTVPTKSTLKTINANASSDGTISVPCGCKKQTTGQPGQNSTSGTTLQGGSGPTQTEGCNPCPVDGSLTQAMTTMICSEYACRYPNPTPTPVPTPTPTPPPYCAPCGGGNRDGGTTSTMYACPMYCVQ
jgi:hypothetical protein